MTLSPALVGSSDGEVKDGKIDIRKKRNREEDDGDLEAEAQDVVLECVEGSSIVSARRGRKAGRRVSGVYKEIKSLHHIGHNAQVMELVFDRMTLKEVMEAGVACSMWYIVACRTFRKRLGKAAFLRLWNSEKASQYLWINWELHFHLELLSGNELDEPTMEEDPKFSEAPSIQAIFSIGSRYAQNQFTDEEAKLPFREDHVFAICQEAIVTAPDYSFMDTFNSKFGLDISIQSLFIPKSQHFTMKAFCIDATKETWTPFEAYQKIELPSEDLGKDQKLTALFLLKYRETDGVLNFTRALKGDRIISILGGNPEEVGSNRMCQTDFVVASGFSFYTGAGATVTVYGIDFTKPNIDEILLKMKTQTESAKHGFCFALYSDGRPHLQIPDSDPNTSMDWEYSEKPEPIKDKLLSAIRTTLPKTPVLGINSIFPVDFHCHPDNSNMGQDAMLGFTFGFLLLTYND